jgi:two-component system, OmpR family, osmolarity sensor histidine kinase EnvZ
VYNPYVEPNQVYHPEGIYRFYLNLEWATFSLLFCTLGAYVIFFWLRRQLRSVVGAARALGGGQTPEPLAETGPEEIRELSRGFNQLALNLDALDADRRFMLAGISHDLSTPLTRLRLAVELMQMKEHPQAAGMIGDIEDMNAILVQFADYVKSGKEEEPMPGDLNHVVAEVCQRYAESGKTIRCDLAPIPAFTFRGLAIRRLVTNLVDNAARYSPADIDVSTRLENGNVTLTVADRGPGISMEPASLIKPFVRENVARGLQSGAGLGLTIVERIARMHGGELSLRNRDGGGLTADVTLAFRGAT